MAQTNFALLETLRGEDNKVQVPRAARAAKGQHKYDPTIINNKAVGYIPMIYEHEDFPKMLYHPKWGMTTAQPEMAKFSVGCVTAEQYQAAFAAYNKALETWQRSNRTKIVGAEREPGITDEQYLAKCTADVERLVKKGWLEKPPVRKDNPAFDLTSDEI